MFTDVYATLSELLVGAASVTIFGLYIWLLQGKGRYTDYFRDRAKRVLYGRQSNGRKPSSRADKLTTAAAHPGSESPSDAKASLHDSFHTYLLYPILGALMLGLGLALESTVDDIIDPNPVGFYGISELIQIPLLSKAKYRFAAIYQPDRWPDHRAVFSMYLPRACESGAYDFHLTSLGYEAFVQERELVGPSLRPLDVRADKDQLSEWTTQQEFMRDPAGFLAHVKRTNDEDRTSREDRKNRCKLATRLAEAIYYDGNDWALSKESTANVLRRWKVEADLVGCLAILGFLTLVPTAIFLCIRKMGRVPDRGKKEKIASARYWCIAGGLVWLYCSYSYVVGLREYTGRAIGMYVSAHRRGEVETSVPGCLMIGRLLVEESRITANPYVSVEACDIAVGKWCESSSARLGLVRAQDPICQRVEGVPFAQPASSDGRGGPQAVPAVAGAKLHAGVR